MRKKITPTDFLPISTKLVEKIQDKEYCSKHDSYYDPETMEWLEIQCKEPRCYYCQNRPDHHSENCQCFFEDDSDLLYEDYDY